VPVCRFRHSERLTSNRYRLTVTSFAAPCAVKPEALQKRRFCAFAELSVLRRIADSELTSCEVAWVPTADVMLCRLGNASAPHWKASAPAAKARRVAILKRELSRSSVFKALQTRLPFYHVSPDCPANKTRGMDRGATQLQKLACAIARRIWSMDARGKRHNRRETG
jgi:hypothetical protein